jgi:hypothetical protein
MLDARSVRLALLILVSALLGVPLTAAQEIGATIAPQTSENPPPDPAAETAGAGEEETPQFYESLDVRARGDDLIGIANSATEGATGLEDLATRPLLRPAELVETVPGVIATQHSGDGKANQYFLRGFNLDHGTDFSVWVDGMPVNMPSHGHGQGYADLNFLIPELVESVRYRKGPYHAEKGDFSAAGGVDMQLIDALPQPLILLTGGSFDYGRTLLAATRSLGSRRVTAALDLFHNNGPWDRGEDYDGSKALLRLNSGDAARGFSVTAMGYNATWLASDQVPRRAVESGLIGSFGLIDPSDRGASRRYSLSAEIHRGTDSALTHLSGYLLSYGLNLFSNFTYFLDDPESGDQFEQTDDRTVAGFEANRSWTGAWGGLQMENTTGVQVRGDDIDNGLFRTRDTQRLATVRKDQIRLLTGGAYAESLVHWNASVRTRLGLRADFYHADVDSDLPTNSGGADDVLLSPKLGLALGPWKQTELYLNAGYGFHSNDARGATIRVDPVTGEPAGRVEPLVRARGAEIGLRTTVLRGLQTTVSLFIFHLDSELIFVGDGGSTEASRPSRRKGIEWSNFYRVNDWLNVDFDATVADAEFTTPDPAGREIPGAIGQTVAAGITLGEGRKLFGGLRWRYFGDAPLVEDGSVRSSSSSLVNSRLGYAFANGLTLELDVFNLLNRTASDIEYFYTSRLPGESVEGVADIHFHPMERRSARLVATWRLDRPGS